MYQMCICDEITHVRTWDMTKHVSYLKLCVSFLRYNHRMVHLFYPFRRTNHLVSDVRSDLVMLLRTDVRSWNKSVFRLLHWWPSTGFTPVCYTYVITQFKLIKAFYLRNTTKSLEQVGVVVIVTFNKSLYHIGFSSNNKSSLKHESLLV